jgi:NAD(P)-dependent dehydrogenase (short-subunit alcohol dehydrogenase family)
MDIQNKTILITGAASGLGAATARELSSRGARTILLDRNIESAEKIAQDISARAFECDVTSENSVQKILSECDDIHAVINCAGIVHGGRIVGKNGVMPLEEFSRVININLMGTFNVMRLAAEKISKQNSVNDLGERGVIINTASIAAFEGQFGQVGYSASKGAIVSMTLPAARELSKYGIRVMTIAPGVMETPMIAGMTEEIQHALAADIPFPKKLGDPKNFGELCTHIIENSYLNGSTIRLDGALRLK